LFHLQKRDISKDEIIICINLFDWDKRLRHIQIFFRGYNLITDWQFLCGK
jgi:hypothetical protein